MHMEANSTSAVEKSSGTLARKANSKGLYKWSLRVILVSEVVLTWLVLNPVLPAWSAIIIPPCLLALLLFRLGTSSYRWWLTSCAGILLVLLLLAAGSRTAENHLELGRQLWQCIWLSLGGFWILCMAVNSDAEQGEAANLREAPELFQHTRLVLSVLYLIVTLAGMSLAFLSARGIHPIFFPEVLVPSNILDFYCSFGLSMCGIFTALVWQRNSPGLLLVSTGGAVLYMLAGLAGLETANMAGWLLATLLLVEQQTMWFYTTSVQEVFARLKVGLSVSRTIHTVCSLGIVMASACAGLVVFASFRS
jgi:hypothetical protein